MNLFRAKIVDVGADSFVIEVTGTEDKVDAFVNMLSPYGIKELVRTGRVAMVRGGMTTVRAPSVNGAEQKPHRSAGEGKPKVGSLI